MEDFEKEHKHDGIIGGIILLAVLAAIVIAGIVIAGIIDSHNEEKTETKKTEFVSDLELQNKKLVRANIWRHNFPIEHPNHHVEKDENGNEYWYCDDQYCWFYCVIHADGEITTGYAHWPCDTDIQKAEEWLKEQGK